MVLRRRVPGLVVAAGVLLVSCGSGLPAGLGAAEVAALSVRQGVAGRLAVRTGYCGALSGSCRVYAPAVRVRAVSVSGGEGFGLVGQGCNLGGDDLPLSGREMAGVEAQDGSVDGEVYSIALQPGRYSVVLVGPGDCVTCLEFASMAGAIERCAVISVSENTVTVADFIQDYAADERGLP